MPGGADISSQTCVTHGGPAETSCSTYFLTGARYAERPRLTSSAPTSVVATGDRGRDRAAAHHLVPRFASGAHSSPAACTASRLDKLLWVLARRLYAGWREHLTLVTPETVVRWHRLLSVLTEFVRYYNQDRPHRTLGLQPPGWRPRPTTGSIQSRAFNSWALLFAIAHAETAEAKPGAP